MAKQVVSTRIFERVKTVAYIIRLEVRFQEKKFSFSNA